MSTQSTTGKVSRRQFFNAFRSTSEHRVSETGSITGLLKKIVFGYERKLPASLVLGAGQLKSKIQETGLNVSVVYHPVSDLPEDVDVILVAKELVKTAQHYAPDAQIIPLKQFKDSLLYDELVTRLVEGVELKAETEHVTERTSESKTVKYRGYQIID
jgi:mannitol-specific phosphotransferase system IIBC component